MTVRSILSFRTLYINQWLSSATVSQLSDEAWMRSVWYGQRTPSTKLQKLTDLPAVVDPEGSRAGSASSALIVFLSTSPMLLVFTLNLRFNRIVDRQGQALDLDYFPSAYYLKRNREADGDSISVIDVMTDRITANNIFTKMNQYYRKKYNWEVTRNV